MRQLTIAALAGAVAFSALPALAQDTSGAKSASDRFIAALSGGDAATAASLFADNGVVLAPGRGEVDGRPQIQQFLGRMTKAVKNLKYTSESITPIDAATAREVGSFSFTTERQGRSDDVAGKYLLIWTKAGNDWKISADMWSRSGGGKRRGGGPAGGAGAPGAGGPGAGGDDSQ